MLSEKAAAILGLGRGTETRQDWAEAARYSLSVSILKRPEELRGARFRAAGIPLDAPAASGSIFPP